MAPGSASIIAIPAPYPARSAFASATIQGAATEVTCIPFSDKIVMTISQAGRINHWMHVPLARTSLGDLSANWQPPSHAEDGPDSSLLPLPQLTATTTLGGTKPEYEVVGQTLATTVATAVLTRDAEEQRTLVFGLGLATADVGREGFDALVGLCLEVL